jgi:hypothetical protein
MGDQNGDGRDDLFVAGTDDYYRDYYGTQAGALFFGGPGIFSGEMDEADGDILFSGTQSGDWNVQALTDIDFDGDGLDDLFMGDYYYGGSAEGQLYYFSSSDMETGDSYDLEDDSRAFFTGDHDGDFLGYSLGGGDMDFDGYEDVIVGAAAEDYDDIDRAGCMYLLEGRPDMDDGSASIGWATDTEICATTEHARLGRNANAQLVDIDGDVALDLIISAPGADSGGTEDDGQVFVFYNDGTFGGVMTTDDADITLTGGDAAYFGYALTVGDFDGDGEGDLAVGAPDGISYDDSMDDPGEVFVFQFATLVDSDGTLSGDDADLRIESGANNQFGNSLTSTDFDGDGVDELLVSSPRWNSEMGMISIFSLR